MIAQVFRASALRRLLGLGALVGPAPWRLPENGVRGTLAARVQVFGVLAGAIALSGCVHTSVMPLSENTFELTASGAPACHLAGTQSVAVHDAAIEAIHLGYDRFIIEGAQQQSEPVGTFQTPTAANTYETATVMGGPNFATGYGSSTTVFSGGSSFIVRRHKQEIIVHMFRQGDPGAQNALSARQLLGSDWQKIVAGGFKGTCL